MDDPSGKLTSCFVSGNDKENLIYRYNGADDEKNIASSIYSNIIGNVLNSEKNKKQYFIENTFGFDGFYKSTERADLYNNLTEDAINKMYYFGLIGKYKINNEN